MQICMEHYTHWRGGTENGKPTMLTRRWHDNTYNNQTSKQSQWFVWPIVNEWKRVGEREKERQIYMLASLHLWIIIAVTIKLNAKNERCDTISYTHTNIHARDTKVKAKVNWWWAQTICHGIHYRINKMMSFFLWISNELFMETTFIRLKHYPCQSRICAFYIHIYAMENEEFQLRLRLFVWKCIDFSKFCIKCPNECAFHMMHLL